MKLLLSYLRPYLKFLWLALILATINQVFSLLEPQITRLIIDNYVSKAGQMPPVVFMQGVSVLLLLSIGTAFVSRVAKNFQDFYVNVITQRVSTKLYENSVKHSFSLPFSVFEDQRSGEVLQKLQKARSDSQAFISGIINVAFLSLVSVTFVLIYAYTVNWLVGTIYALLIPIVGFSVFFITRRVKKLQQTIVGQTTELAGSTTETLRNVELVKSLGLEEQEIDRLNSVNSQILQLELKKIRTVRTLSFLQGTLVNTSRAALLVGMLWLVANQSLTLGEYFSLIFYSFFVFGPLGELGNVATQYQETRASLEQLDSILKQPSEIKPANPKVVGELKQINFDNVSFQYPSATRQSLSDISLSLPAGKTIALVGPSGSGKSTVVKLLVGLYHPDSGKISINDMDSAEIDYEEFRHKIGFVSQETQLFASSIRENLLFVQPTATDDELMLALEHASATELIERAPEGLDTKIGEGGIKISGGERQRLAIARALLRNPELIVFDEATSSLDSLTEQAITDTIKGITKLRPNLMMVLVAHRLSTIAHSDIIYVFENGKIIEQGGHADLLSRSGLYSALWRQQSGQE